MNPSSGTIEVIFGPMFCGKSTELIRRIRRHTVAKKSCLLIKYARDNRYAGNELASTHDRTVWEAFPCTRLDEAWDRSLKHHVIGVDEGQFVYPSVQFRALAHS